MGCKSSKGEVIEIQKRDSIQNTNYDEESLSCLSHVSLNMAALEKSEDLKDLVQQNMEARNQPGSDQQYKPIIILGPSGVGKSTLINALTAKWPNSFGFSVSYTTRQPREGEEHGKNYFFTSQEDFQKMIDQDDFIEWCKVHSNMYGTAKSQIKSI